MNPYAQELTEGVGLVNSVDPERRNVRQRDDVPVASGSEGTPCLWSTDEPPADWGIRAAVTPQRRAPERSNEHSLLDSSWAAEKKKGGGG